MYELAFRSADPQPDIRTQPYNVVDALDPEAPMAPYVFLNSTHIHNVGLCRAGRADSCADNATRAALHAPISKDWVESILYPFCACFII